MNNFKQWIEQCDTAPSLNSSGLVSNKHLFPSPFRELLASWKDKEKLNYIFAPKFPLGFLGDRTLKHSTFKKVPIETPVNNHGITM